jgi:hypothetical protein
VRRQLRAQLTAQRTTCLHEHEQRQVDRLVRHPHLRLISIRPAQPARDLLRRPALPKLLLHDLTQSRTRGELGALRPPRPPPRRLIGGVRPIALMATVAVDLSRDRGVTAPDPRPDHLTALTARETTRDLLALLLRQASLRALSRRRFHPARRSHIPTHVLRPGAELARDRPQRRSALAPQLPHAFLLALAEPEPSHRGDHLHQPGSQASRPDVSGGAPTP